MKRLVGAIKRHKWRYLAIVGGFILLVSPAALLIRAANFLQGSAATADLHKACFRMPFDWIASGKFATFDGRFFLIAFLVGAVGSAFFLGPLFCGWLCPVGSSSELISRPVPKKFKINLTKKISPTALRYGFLGSFVLVSALAAFVPATGLASICCRYCSSAQLQSLVNGIFDPSVFDYWHSGGLMVLGGWLLIGGVFWQGGRGWCLYGCPLGAVSNIFHTIGSKIPWTFKIKHNPENCTECHKCEDVCPSWAINRHSKEIDINRNTCTACMECVKVCQKGCFSYGKG
jgi:ferredoxin-type protein NapH